MQGIYSCVPETNHVSRVYSVAAVQYLQFVLHTTLLRPSNMSRTFTLLLLLLLLLLLFYKGAHVSKKPVALIFSLHMP